MNGLTDFRIIHGMLLLFMLLSGSVQANGFKPAIQGSMLGNKAGDSQGLWQLAQGPTKTAVGTKLQIPGAYFSGKVFNGPAGDQRHPRAGYAVSLKIGDREYGALTAADGRFAFADVDFAPGEIANISVDSCDGCLGHTPVMIGGSVQPADIQPQAVSLPSCGTETGCVYPSVHFFLEGGAVVSRKAGAGKLADAVQGVVNPVLANDFSASFLPASVVDVTSETGQLMTGPLTSWQTPDGPYNVEHLAGRNISNDLIVLYWSPRNGHWIPVNVSAETGYQIAGPVTSWQTPDGPYLVEHLAGRALNGDLIVFYWAPNTGGWRAVNVTQITGVKIANTVTSWQTPNGPYTVEHLAGVDPLGQLMVFYWSPAHDWQAVNVSQKTGVLVKNQPTAWQVRSGGLLNEYLAATNADSSLFVFSWSPAQDWQAVNLTQQTGYRVVGNVSSWMTGPVQHIGGQSSNNYLLTFWRSDAGRWFVVNVSQITGEQVKGEPAVYQMADGNENVELLSSRNSKGQLVTSWWKPSRDWQAMNLSEMTGQNIASVPTGWVTPNAVEHLAATTSTNRVLVFYGYTRPRQLTDSLGREWLGMKRMRNIRRNVLTILWDPHRPGHPAPTREEMIARIHGPTDSIKGYFLENSNGSFTIQNAGVLGWYDADKPGDHYWDNADHDGSYHDGWTSGHAEKWAEAIRKADRNFNFAAYDSNRDGRLSPDELAILIAIPQSSPFGTNRGVVGIQVPSSQPLVVDGVTIPVMAEWYTGVNPVNFPVAAHELSHLLLNQGDLYFTIFNPFAAGDFSLMDQTYQRNHLDPLAKLKLGWVSPKIVFRSGRYSLKDVATGHGVWILMDPNRGADEYFIVENRWKGASLYERDLDDQGLAVWRITENQALWDLLPPPPNVSAADWASISHGRRAIQLLRPYTERSNAFGPIQLWDAATGYELQSVDVDPAHTALRWADGSPSGFALRAPSAEGPVMEADLQVP